jgi:hypothetical protein
MFARFCGFGPGHKSTHHVTKVFRDEFKEGFGLGHGKDDMGEIFEARECDHDSHDSDSEHADEEESVDESDSDSESEENSEPEDLWDDGDVDYFAFEEELGYAPL